MNIEAGKFYNTRDGRRARIYAIDSGGDFPVHGAIFDEGHWLLPDGWKLSGRYYSEDAGSQEDLVSEASPPHPLDGVKPGDPIWVRDSHEATWVITLFVRLEKNGTVVSTDHFGDAEEWYPMNWDFGVPYVAGVAPPAVG